MRLPKLLQPKRTAGPKRVEDAALPDWRAWDDLPATVYVKGPDKRLLYVNQRFAREMTLEAGQMLGKRTSDLFDGPGVERLEQQEGALLEGRSDSFLDSFALRIRGCKSGDRLVMISGYSLELPGGGRGLAGIAIDAGGFAQTEIELARERDFIRTVLDTADTLIVVLDLDHRIRRWNRACERSLGRHESEVRGRSFVELLYDPDDAAALGKVWSELRTGNSPQTGTTPVRHSSGSQLWLNWSAAPVPDDAGRPEYIVITAVDITHQVRAEHQQYQLAQEFRAVWESARDSMLFLDAEGRIAAANPSFLKLAGAERAEVEGRPYVEFFREWPGHESEEIERYRSQFAARDIEASTTREYALRSGERLWLECSNSFLARPGKGTILLQVMRNITGRMQTEQELRSTNEFLKTTTQWAREMAANAELASAAKSEFLANVSHEIRTPMNGVLGMTELALTTQLTPEQREYLDLVRSSAESLLTLLDDLLDLSKIEAGRMELDPAPFDLRALIADAMRPMKVRGSARGVDVSWHVDREAPVWVAGDKGRLRQVLLNLVGNSIKYTDAGWVRLDVDCLGRPMAGKHRLRFVVSDSGIGIEDGNLEKIFEPFTQVAGKPAGRRGGTGLGLSISSRLVELMGGRLYVASRAGEGSALSFVLECPALQPEAEAPATPRATVEPSRTLRCLVAEDHPVNQRLMTGLMKHAGWECDVVATGTAAVEAWRRGGYDIVLMDVQMPGMDGLEAARIVRAEERASGRHIPILAMTAHAMPGDRERCLEAGMDGYVAKPIRLNGLYEEIARVTSLPAAIPQQQESQGEPQAMRRLVDSGAALARVGGDSQLLGELAALFLEEYPRLMAKVTQFLREGSLDGVREQAHQIKGLLAQFGCETGREIAVELENSAQQGDRTAAGDAAFRLNRILDSARPDFEKLARPGPEIQ